MSPQAYTSICDLLILFAEQLATLHHAGEASVRRLVLECDAPLADLLNAFIQEFVFVHHNYGNTAYALTMDCKHDTR